MNIPGNPPTKNRAASDEIPDMIRRYREQAEAEAFNGVEVGKAHARNPDAFPASRHATMP